MGIILALEAAWDCQDSANNSRNLSVGWYPHLVAMETGSRESENMEINYQPFSL